MSCQQVPRLPEDPYTFTEPPVTAKYYSSQSHKVQSNKLIARSQSTAVTPKSFQKNLKQRVTGQSPLGGLLPKRNGPIYGTTTNRQQQQQQQQHQQHQPPHLPPTLPNSVAHAAPDASSAHNNVPSHPQPVGQQLHNSATVTNDLLPPPFSSVPVSTASNQLSNHPPICITTAHNAAEPKTSVVPSLGQPITERSSPSIKRAPPVRQQPNTEHPVDAAPLHLHSKVSAPLLNDNQTTAKLDTHKTVAKQQSTINTTKTSTNAIQYTLNKKSQFRGDLEFAAFATKHKFNKSTSLYSGRVEKPTPPTHLYRKNSISSTCSSSASSSPPSFPSDQGHGHGMFNSEDSFFVRPIKVESKTSPPTFAAALSSSQPSDVVSAVQGGATIVRSKRRYSQTSHHEALQRIHSDTIKVEDTKLNDDDDDTKAGIVKLEPNEPTVIVAPIRNRRPQEWSAPGVHFGIAPDLPAPGSSSYPQPSLDAQQCWFTNRSRFSNRDQRLDHKLTLVRRQARQLSAAQRFRSIAMPRRRLKLIAKSLDLLTQKPQRLCDVVTCKAAALVEATFCPNHIVRSKQQQLFHTCTAKFADNTQCRLAVFDISHELPLCTEHAWKLDNYTRKTQEIKPKRISTPTPRKKSKNCAQTRAPKRNRKKKAGQKIVPSLIAHPQPHMSPATRLYQAPDRSPISTQHFALSSNDSFVSSDVSQMFPPSPQHQTPVHHQQQHQFYPFQQTIKSHQQLIQSNLSNHPFDVAQQRASAPLDQNQLFGQMLVTSDGSTPSSQELYTLCENSSAYESSEDTGIGGLSESEQQLMGVHDDMLEDHDITTVLNQLPQNAFDELFTTGHQTGYKPTAEEEEFLERALEAVDEQVKTLQEMTGADHFFDDFLDVDEQILEDVDMCGVDESIHLNTGLTSVSGASSTSIGSIIDIRGLVHT